MTLLPVIERELLMRARQGGTYWTRCAVGTTAVLVGLLQVLVSGSVFGAAAMGKSAFGTLSWMAFLMACGCAVVTADCLSRERREGTLGLLLLTELKGADV